MSKELFVKAEEVARELGISKTTAFLDLRRKCSKYFPFYLAQHPYRGHP